MSFEADVSLEFAHLYADQDLSEKHFESLDHLKAEVSRLNREGKTYSSLVLVDDIHACTPKNSLDEIKERLEMRGGKVDQLLFESQLLGAVKKLLSAIPKSKLFFQPFKPAPKRVLFLRTETSEIALGNIINRKFKPTCALLVATWNLARLGKIEVADLPRAKSTLSILEEKYRGVEEKALRIIEQSEFSNEAQNIFHIFY